MKKKALKKQAAPISDVLRQAILNAGVSRYRLAAELGVSQAMLSRFVNGVSGVSLKMADRFAAYLGFELVRREGK